jgi:hypothetical protein
MASVGEQIGTLNATGDTAIEGDIGIKIPYLGTYELPWTGTYESGVAVIGAAKNTETFYTCVVVATMDFTAAFVE